MCASAIVCAKRVSGGETLSKSASASASAGVSNYRLHIQGMRGLAVVAVLAAHLNLPFARGGFTGVDVFYVISGFLLIGILYREALSTGRISVRRFYGHRARRILPAAFTVLAAVSWFASLTQNQLAAASVRGDAIWSMLFMSNFAFIEQGRDYFAAGESISPLLHFWSLAVEEQFYLVLPGVILALLALSRWSQARRSLDFTRMLVVALSLIVMASLLWSAIETARQPTTAYLSTSTRAWELAVGGLAAILDENRLLTDRIRAWLGEVGLLGFLLSVVAVTPDAFPGITAVLPVSAAVALLLGGGRGPASRRVLTTRVVLLTGTVSYSLYLWHWPVAVYLGFPARDAGASQATLLFFCVITGLLTAATYVCVERPFRLAQWGLLRTSCARTGWRRRGWAPGALVAGLCVFAAVLWAFILGFSPSAGVFAARSEPAAFAPAADRPTIIEGTLLTQWQQRLSEALTTEVVPATLQPNLAEVPTDRKYFNCLNVSSENEETCSWGADAAPRLAVVLGDSHALMWMPALQLVLPPKGFKLKTPGLGGCPNSTVRRWEPAFSFMGDQCAAHHRWVLERLRALRPDLVVLSDFSGFVNWQTKAGEVKTTGYREAWASGLEEFIKQVVPLAREVVIIGQTPRGQALSDCLPRTLELARCFGDDNYMRGQRGIERRVVLVTGGKFVDPSVWLCVGSKCPPVIDNSAVFHDDNHLSASMAVKLAPMLRLSFEELRLVPVSSKEES